MQKELATEGLALGVAIGGINPMGQESGNTAMCDGRDLPWLQETAADSTSTWSTWAVTYRDVVILDPDNEKAGVYNLTTHDLGNPAHYAELKQMFRDAVSAASR